jgi:hypothetical protein
MKSGDIPITGDGCIFAQFADLIQTEIELRAEEHWAMPTHVCEAVCEGELSHENTIRVLGHLQMQRLQEATTESRPA